MVALAEREGLRPGAEPGAAGSVGILRLPEQALDMQAVVQGPIPANTPVTCRECPPQFSAVARVPELMESGATVLPTPVAAAVLGFVRRACFLLAGEEMVGRV